MTITSAHRAGEQLGRFALVRRLGAGGMSEVWEATDDELGRPVAIKLLRPDRIALDKTRARLQREAKVMAGLRHPNIAVVHDIGRVGEHDFIAMELMRCTLREWLTERARGWRAIIHVLLAAGRGLAAAHQAGIIHRDVKPDNILIGEAGEVKIADFGIARGLDGAFDLGTRIEPLVALTTGDQIAGTPAYMAPEQILGRTVDTRADQYSFCVTIWEALFGRLPFVPSVTDGVPTLASQLSAIIGGMIVRGDTNVPRSVERVLRRVLCADPDARFATVHELCEALARTTRSRRRMVGAAITSLSATVALAVIAIIVRSRPTSSDNTLVVRTLVSPSAEGQIVTMARDGEHFAICRGDSLQLVSASGVQQSSIALPHGFSAGAVAISARGEDIVVGGHFGGNWELWRLRSADGARQRIAVFPDSNFDGVIEIERPPSIAIVEPDVLVAIASRVFRVDAAGTLRAVIDDTDKSDRRFDTLRGVPGTRNVSLREEIGDLTRIRVLDFNGSTVRTIETPGYVRSYDWLNGTRIVLSVSGTNGSDLFAMETLSRRRGDVMHLGTIDHRVYDLYASPRRLAGRSSDVQQSLITGFVQRGGWTSMNTAGWSPWPIGWLDAGTVIGTGRMSRRRSIVAFGLATPPRVLQQEALGVPVFYDNNQFLLLDSLDGRCILRSYRDGHAVGELDLGCTLEPILICADRLHEPCVLARWEANNRVYRAFDPKSLAIKDVKFVEPTPDRSHLQIIPAISRDGMRLAIPRPSGHMLFVDLHDGSLITIDNMRGDGWQFATWIPGTTSILATSIGPGPIHNRVDRVDINGSVTTLYEPTSGYVLALAVSRDGNQVVITRAATYDSELIIDLDSVTPARRR